MTTKKELTVGYTERESSGMVTAVNSKSWIMKEDPFRDPKGLAMQLTLFFRSSGVLLPSEEFAFVGKDPQEKFREGDE